jgi:cytosine/adenosine deaminase-related metal-dependent hydrolase
VIYANAHVVTMDDDGTEHEDGGVQVEDGLVTAVGGGTPLPGERVDLA